MTSRIVTADNTEDPVCDSKLVNITMYLITQTIRMSQILQTGLQKAGDVLMLYLAVRAGVGSPSRGLEMRLGE